ncbi:hypothetical protein COCMIDRAFT_91356 [Bipolaris oryzae ATCC 44560]|uniref:Uncharacterized protein n=1 Tax=Bipolaris oryzae ATCC 44560 TaxID=930090 RepID=W6Z5F9_COCMI|nr:uncharacterized protein COCMIDRAFT_91356 [Bipolaris oryzae ATCC 44560]EUC47007.1 hypothetical protein COCMIDRAFT_91356 [Bipolaris oryzae ATCC 44560]
MAKKTPSNRPTTSRRVNKTTPSDTRVTGAVESLVESQILCEDTSFSENISPYHSRGRLTPTSPSIVDLESDSESVKKCEDFRPSLHSFNQLAEAFASPSYYASYIDRTAMVKQLKERMSEMKEKYCVAFDASMSELEEKLATNPDQIGHSDEEYPDLDDELSKDEEQDTAQAERHKAERIADDAKASTISRLKKNSILEDTSKPVKQTPSATAKSSNAKVAPIADPATFHAPSLSAKHDETRGTKLANALFKFCINSPEDFTAKEAYNVLRMCGGDADCALILYQQAADDPSKLKQTLKRWMSSHPENDDSGTAQLCNEANETGIKEEYCESEASDDTAHSDKDHHDDADDTWTDDVWGTKTAIQHVKDCLNTWCNGRCVEELAQEVDPTTVRHGSTKLEKDDNTAQYIGICSCAWPRIGSCRVCSELSRQDIHQDDSDPKTASAFGQQDVPDDTTSAFTGKLSEPTDYTVSYWATIEHEGQMVHIPIDSSNVTGPEKSIIEGAAGMNKVWKWVQEKGLMDMVSLQDAFDLAKDMHVESPTVVDKACQTDGEGDDDSECVPSSSSSGSSASEIPWGAVPAPRDWATSKTILGYAK